MDISFAEIGPVTWKLDQVHRADCIKALAKVDAGTVDLAFADPPFNIGYEYDVYDDSRSAQEYLRWCQQWIGGVYTALKPDGTFWLAIGDEFAAELKVKAQETGFHCRSWVIWYYTFGVNCVRGFSRSHTHLFHFVKDPNRFTFNHDNPAVRVPSARQLVYSDARANPRGRLPDNTWILRPQDAPQGSFADDQDTWYFARVAGTFKEREGFHGCQMPEQLLGRIIRTCSNSGDVVLDPFGGSGTTLVVAKKLGRRWLGFELSESYAKHITSRLQKTQVGDELDGPEDAMTSAPKTKTSRAAKLARDKAAEHREIVAQAFGQTAKGYSVDQLLADPQRNEQFVAKCEDLGLKASAVYCNRALLKARKAGKLPKHNTPGKRPSRDLDGFSFASEIAMQRLQIEYDKTLDELLCDPEVAASFDDLASSFAPGYSPFQYRWAALAIRKRAKQAKKWASEHFANWLAEELPRGVSFSKAIAKAPEEAGVYVLSRGRQALYVGEAQDIRKRLVQIADNMAPWEILEPTSVKWIPCAAHRTGLQSALIQRLRPTLNSRLLNPRLALSNA